LYGVVFKGVSTFENPKNSLLLSFWLVWLVSLRGTGRFFPRLMSQKIFLEGTKKLKKRGGGEEVQHPKKGGTKHEQKNISKVTSTTTTPRHKKTLTLDDQRESLWSSVSWFDRATKAQTWSFLFDAARVSP